ncbi:MAG: hypothetical protein NW703_03975 [Nitrospiraceae bacterium]
MSGQLPCSLRRVFCRCVGFILISVLVAGCGSKGPVYQEDHLRFARIYDAVESLRKDYVEKDLPGIRDLLLSSDQLDQLLTDVEADFRAYDAIVLDLAIERILIDGDHIDMYVHWQGQWKPHGTDVPIRERGHGRLQWVGNQSILLRAVDGDLPFGMGTRQMRLNRPAPSAGR